MNGIFAYTGDGSCRDLLLGGLEFFDENRESVAGMSVLDGGTISTVRVKGGAGALSEKAQSFSGGGKTGIAAVRGALRCKPAVITSVPAVNSSYSVAMLGCIENYYELKSRINSPLPIATDEDLLLALLCAGNGENRIDIIKKIIPSIKGSPSFVFAAADENAVYFRCGAQPLAVGISESGMFISSRIEALAPFVNRLFILNYGDRGKITRDRATVFNIKNKRSKRTLLSPPKERCPLYQPSGFIQGCPYEIKNLCSRYTKEGRLISDSFGVSKKTLERADRIIISGEGSALGAARLASEHFQQLSDLSCKALASGELRYSGEVITKNTVLIVIGSGESEDNCAVIRRARLFGAQIIGISKSTDLFLQRLCDANLTYDLPQSSCRINGFCSQYLCLCFLMLYIGFTLEIVSELYLNIALRLLDMLPSKAASALKAPQIYFTRMISQSGSVILTGTGADFALAAEAQNSVASFFEKSVRSYPLSEIETSVKSSLDGTLVIAFITSKEMCERALIKLRRLRLLGAEILLITGEDISEEITDFENIAVFSGTLPLFDSVTALIKLHTLAEAEESLSDTTAAG